MQVVMLSTAIRSAESIITCELCSNEKPTKFAKEKAHELSSEELQKLF
jgi:hypothetical protein